MKAATAATEMWWNGSAAAVMMVIATLTQGANGMGRWGLSLPVNQSNNALTLLHPIATDGACTVQFTTVRWTGAAQTHHDDDA